MRKAVALYHLLLTVIIGGIVTLTLYAGTCYPRTVQLPDGRQRIAASSGEETADAPGGTGGTGEIESTQPALSPKTGGSEPWYG